MDITQLRQEIDRVDEQLVQLFVQRMNISSHIADYKKEQQIPIFDPNREREKLNSVAQAVDPAFESSVKVLYSLLFELSRSYQSEKNATETALFQTIAQAIEKTDKLLPSQAIIACQCTDDPRVSAGLERLIKSPSPLFFHTLDGVISAVEQEMCPYGLLSLDDGVVDLLCSHGFYIVRTIRIPHTDGTFTRYALFGKQLEIYPGADRTTLALVLPNCPGSLYRVLARLYALGLNVARISSRPMDDYRMRFYFDLETSVYSREFLHLMCELEDLTAQFRYLGSYSEVI